jgi:hypothetical protein
VPGQDHATRHDVATPDMIRQLPVGFALVIRGGYAPVIARLPRAWNNLAYRRARWAHRHRQGLALRGRPFPLSAEPEPEPGTETELEPGPDAFPDHLPPGWASGDDSAFPWS